MSVRPRPVTASLKYGLPPPPTLPPRARLDETGDSTLSLISINDHYSLSESESDHERPLRPTTAPPRQKTQPRKRLERKTRRLSSEGGNGELSPWEKWLVEKEALLREKLQKDLQLQRSKQVEEERKKTEELSKLQKAEENRKKWTQKKVSEARQKQRNEESEKQLKEKLEADKQRTVQQKATAEFSKWLNKKKEREEQEKRKIEQKQQQKKREQEEKQEKADAAYRKWLEEHKSRPKSAPAPYSYGYTNNGKLTRYHDKGGYPEPEFVNPVPWKHPDIPHYNTDRLQAKRQAKKMAKLGRVRKVAVLKAR